MQSSGHRDFKLIIRIKEGLFDPSKYAKNMLRLYAAEYARHSHSWTPRIIRAVLNSNIRLVSWPSEGGGAGEALVPLEFEILSKKRLFFSF